MIRRFAAAFLLTFASLAASHGAASAETAIFAGGCFWCVQSDFDHVGGVTATAVGYIGGSTSRPTYRNYASGGHREAVKITFDPGRISYARLVDVFFRSVDPTDAGGQFCDRGHAYTTAIYTTGSAQAATARAGKQKAANALGRAIVTPVRPAPRFWRAEDYHQKYYKSRTRTLTRFGYVTRARAYRGYRKACGRNARVRQVWGKSALEGIRGH